jgi:hypothetical protein
LDKYKGIKVSGYKFLFIDGSRNKSLLVKVMVNSATFVTNGLTGVGFQLVNRLDANTLNVYYQGVLQNTNSSASVAASCTQIKRLGISEQTMEERVRYFPTLGMPL